MITVPQLIACGWGKGAIEYAVRRGWLLRLHRGVYAVGHSQLRKEGRWLAAVLACGEGTALSWASAAAHLDLRASSAVLIDVTVPTARRQRPGIRLHHPRNLEPQDIIDHQGIPTTSPTRTVIDLARTLPVAALETLVANAQHRDLLDYERLARAHSGKLRRILGTGPQRKRSGDEDRFVAAVRTAGLPEPEVNVWLTHGRGEEWQPDLVFRDERVIVEIDDDRHKTATAFERDREKDAVRVADGWMPLRFTRRQIREDLAGRVALLARTLELRRPAARGAR